MNRCYRCNEEKEKLYLVPYVHKQFCDVEICRECSLEFHRVIQDFSEKFIQNKKGWIYSARREVEDQLIRDLIASSSSTIVSEWGGEARCITSDGRNVNMAEELNRLEKELENGMD